MSDWGKGYVTDIEYSDGFYGVQAPAHLELVGIINGIEAPSLDGPFAYCELGCGRGQTSLVLAAINPEAEFHAVDFNPAHIAHAREKAQRAKLPNVQFHEISFADLPGARGRELPMFDIVTMHGVWSWVAPDLQRAIIEFLNARLKPGGLVHLSYNALPAWNRIAPIQRLVKELTGTQDRSDRAIAQTIQQIERLAQAKIIPERLEEGVKRLKEHSHALLPYLAHEYLNEHWHPLYFADVARSLTDAKLNFVGSGDLLKNFNNLMLNEEQRALIADIPSAELRETLKDFCIDHWFRQDLFVRGARRMSAARREALLGALSIALLRPAPPMLEVQKPDGSRWRPDSDVYQTVGKALARSPGRIGELLHLEGLPAGHLVGPVELLGILVGMGIAGLYRKPSVAQLQGAERLNALLEHQDELVMSQSVTLAVPSLRTGVPLSPPSYLVYQSLRKGETPDADVLATRFIKQCRAAGGHPIVDGKSYEDEREAQEVVRSDFETKLESLVPLWRTNGII
jgi:SAM-dependent methyltransferase